MAENDSDTAQNRPAAASPGKKKAKKARKKTKARASKATAEKTADAKTAAADKPQTENTQPAGSGTSEKTTPPPAASTRSGSPAGAIALVLVLLVVATLVWLLWIRGWWSLNPAAQQDQASAGLQQLQQQVSDLNSRLEQLDSQDPQSMLEPLLQDAREQADQSLQDTLQPLTEQNQQLRQTITDQQDRLRALENRLADVSSEQQQTQTVQVREQALLEIRLLLRHARQQLLLNGNSDAAVAAYEDAEQVLSGADIPGSDGLRDALISERQSIQTVTPPDIDSLISELRGLQQAALLWPLHGQPGSAGQQAPDEDQNWRDKLRNSFGQLVQVRRSDQTIIGVEEASLIRQQLGLQLQTAGLLALQGRQEAFGQVVHDARRLLEQSYDTENRGVEAAIQALQSMREVELMPEWPALDAAVQQLDRLDGGAGG